MKSERHHWWPKGLSKFWADEAGFVHWLKPDGSVVASQPSNFGVIGNGHHILMGEPGQETFWDTSFEKDFQRADDSFPSIITWLERLDRKPFPDGTPLRDRFLSVEATDNECAILVEGLISLAVRHPMNRESAVSLAEHLRGPMGSRERNRLIGLNMRNTHKDATEKIGIGGKYVAIYSPNAEFVFGDGFFHTIRSPVISSISPTILSPLTPNIAVMFVRPRSYTTLPRFFTFVVNSAETLLLNNTVQVYSKNMILFRSEKPAVTDAFKSRKHLQYSMPDNPVQTFIHGIPGVPPRDRSLDFLFGRG